MATSSCIVAVPDDTHLFRGRYVNSDGHPAKVGAELALIVARDGVASAIRVLIEDHVHGWSSIQASLSADATHQTHQEPVPGYGIAYTSGPQTLLTSASRAGCDWAYVLTPQDGIIVWQHGDDGCWSQMDIVFEIA